MYNIVVVETAFPAVSWTAVTVEGAACLMALQQVVQSIVQGLVVHAWFKGLQCSHDTFRIRMKLAVPGRAFCATCPWQGQQQCWKMARLSHTSYLKAPQKLCATTQA